jgi:hypothetical protein
MTTDRRRRPKPAQESRIVATGLAAIAMFALITGMAWTRPPTGTTPGPDRTTSSTRLWTGGATGTVGSGGSSAPVPVPAPPPSTSGGS